MQRIPSKEEKEYPWVIRKLFGLQKKKYGRVLESAKVWARSTRVFLGLTAFYGAIDRKSSPIDPELKGLLIVVVSQINNCRFCIELNEAQLLKTGVSREKIDTLRQFQESSLFSEKEKAALAFAQAAIRFSVTDEIFSGLKEHFSDDEIVEITAIIAFQQCSTTFNIALNISSI